MDDLSKRVRELEWQVTQLAHDLIHDPLTGLKTRAYFEEQVGPYLKIIENARSKSESQRKERFGYHSLSVIFFDIDKFKSVNDTYGHEAGDLVLQEVASVIKGSFRAGDTAARWGGEEMVASLLGADEAGAAAKAEEVRKRVAALAFAEPRGLKVTISSGVAAFEPGIELKELVKRADQALYAAKQTGRNKVVRYSELRSKI
jgi:diguanylate cyclase (GGDEF)-like protein